jgi:hypothetical protein
MYEPTKMGIIREFLKARHRQKIVRQKRGPAYRRYRQSDMLAVYPVTWKKT